MFRAKMGELLYLDSTTAHMGFTHLRSKEDDAEMSFCPDFYSLGYEPFWLSIWYMKKVPNVTAITPLPASLHKVS